MFDRFFLILLFCENIESSEKLFSLLAQHSVKQDIFVVSIEVKGTANPLVKISLWERGIHNSQILAHCSPHGDWIEWLVDGY